MEEILYECAKCHGVFAQGRTEEEAEKELAFYFPKERKEDCVLVCDDCWKQIHPNRN